MRLNDYINLLCYQVFLTIYVIITLSYSQCIILCCALAEFAVDGAQEKHHLFKLQTNTISFLIKMTGASVASYLIVYTYMQ